MSIVLSVLGVQPYLREYGLDYSSLAIFCLLYGFVGSFISLLFSKQFAKWGYGVQVIDPNTPDHQLRALVQIVHSLSKRVGIDKMPEVGIYQSDDINAFATGATKNSSLVAVSTGLLRHMEPDEIEGVLGHEISHIGNGDMVTMALLQGVVNAFCMFLSRAVAYALTIGRGSENNGGSQLAYFLVRLVLDVVFMMLGSILVAAFSRYREFRADEGGARLAGKEKMVRALQKLQAQFDRIQPQTGTASALMISNKPVGLMEKLFSTHPPLEKRISKLLDSN
jgi:heat shock protein HtpX